MSSSDVFDLLDRLRREYHSLIDLTSLRSNDAEAFVARLIIAAHLFNIRAVSDVDAMAQQLRRLWNVPEPAPSTQ